MKQLIQNMARCAGVAADAHYRATEARGAADHLGACDWGVRADARMWEMGKDAEGIARAARTLLVSLEMRIRYVRGVKP